MVMDSGGTIISILCYLPFILSGILCLVGWILCLIDAFSNNRPGFGILMILLGISVFFYIPSITNKKRKKATIYFLIAGVSLGIIGIIFGIILYKVGTEIADPFVYKLF